MKGRAETAKPATTPRCIPSEAGEVGYLEVRRALERVNESESYRAVARDLPNLTRQGLMKIDKDPARRGWYLGAEADDERVATALETVR